MCHFDTFFFHFFLTVSLLPFIIKIFYIKSLFSLLLNEFLLYSQFFFKISQVGTILAIYIMNIVFMEDFYDKRRFSIINVLKRN